MIELGIRLGMDQNTIEASFGISHSCEDVCGERYVLVLEVSQECTMIMLPAVVLLLPSNTVLLGAFSFCGLIEIMDVLHWKGVCISVLAHSFTCLQLQLYCVVSSQRRDASILR